MDGLCGSVEVGRGRGWGTTHAWVRCVDSSEDEEIQARMCAGEIFTKTTRSRFGIPALRSAAAGVRPANQAAHPPDAT